MPTPVTDPDLIAQLNAPQREAVGSSRRVWGDQEAEAAGLYETPTAPTRMRPVTDANLLSQLNATQSGRPRITVTPDRAVADRFGEFEQPENAAEMQTGLIDRGIAMTRGPEVSQAQQISTDFQNQAIAAGQRTTPNIRSQMKNLISDQVFENDAGFAVYRDPATGQLVEAQDNQHVVMRDPVDNQLKVFNRSEDTDEGALSAGGRLMGTGLAAGAVTRRPAIPTASNVEVRASDIQATAKPYYRGFSRQAERIGVPVETATGIADRLRGRLERANFIEELAPAVYKAVSILDKGEPLTLDALQNIKRVVGRSFNSPDKNVRDAASVVSGEISKVISEVSPSAGKSLKTADEIHATAKSLQELQRKGAVADLRAGRAGYGGNAVNSMRQVLSPIVQKSVEGRITGFKPNEIQAMREIVEGTAATNTLRGVGQLSPSKGAIQTIGSAGAMYAAGPAAALIPAIGAVSNKAATIMTGKQIDQLKGLVAKRSPAYAEAVKKALERYDRAQMEFVNQPTSNKFAAYLSASRQLSSGLTRDGIQITSGDLLRAIQGPMRSAAEDEQPKPIGVGNQ